MAFIDTNLIVGACPFRTIPADVAGLQALRQEAELDLGIATGFDSLFYYDPIEGLARDMALFESLADWLRFYAVINPRFPRLEQQIQSAADNPRIAGLRLFPTLHQYSLDSDCVQRALKLAHEARLPVNVTARLVDARVAPCYLDQRALERSEIHAFLSAIDRTTVILSMFFFSELKAIAEELHRLDGVYIDVGCSKPSVQDFDGLPRWFPPGRVLFGTGAPLYYWAGSRLAVQGSRLAPELQDAILGNNALELFAWM